MRCLVPPNWGIALAVVAGKILSWKAATVAALCFIAFFLACAAVVAAEQARTDRAEDAKRSKARAAQKLQATALVALQEALADVNGDLMHLQATIDALAQVGSMHGGPLFLIPGSAKVLACARNELKSRATQAAMALTLHVAPAGNGFVDCLVTNIAGDELAALRASAGASLEEVRGLFANELQVIEDQVCLLPPHGHVWQLRGGDKPKARSASWKRRHGRSAARQRSATGVVILKDLLGAGGRAEIDESMM